MTKIVENYENFIIDQFENDNYLQIDQDCVFDYCHAFKAPLKQEPQFEEERILLREFIKVRIENAFINQGEIISQLPILVENAFLTAIRKANSLDIETIKDKVFQNPENELNILNREFEKYNNKNINIHGDMLWGLVDTYSIRNTIYEIILQLAENAKFPTNDGLWIEPTNEYFSELIIPLIQAQATTEWCREQIERITDSEKGTTETTNQQPETTEQKIKRILEQLRGAFSSTKHIDKIIAGLIEYSKDNRCTIFSDRSFVLLDNDRFYEPFVRVWKEIGLTPENIGEVLPRFIYQNNNSRKEISQATIRKNIYVCSKKLDNRNRP